MDLGRLGHAWASMAGSTLGEAGWMSKAFCMPFISDGHVGASGNRASDVMTQPIPVVVEELHVDKREVETARVLVRKRVVEEQHAIDVPLRVERVEIERVAIDRVVDRASGIRQEGEVTIVPVYEEVMVKQLMLKEELRITRRSSLELGRPEYSSLRREEVEVTRTPIAGSAHAGEGSGGSD